MSRYASIGLALLGATGCGGLSELAWEFEFSDSAVAAAAVRVEGSILEGGCTGTQIYASTATRTTTPDPPGELGSGVYGFRGVAIDADCVEIATGCVEVTLPSSAGTITVTLDAIAGPARCPAAECAEGVCGEATDAGPGDAGGADAGGSDAGQCAVSADCGECGRCAAGACIAADDGDPCAGGACVAGACCTGCVISGACVAGTEDAACGVGGGACVACVCPTDSCNMGACSYGRSPTDVAASSSNTCVLDAGALFCAGPNELAQLANGNAGMMMEAEVPAMAAGGLTFDAIADGDDHFFGLMAGTLYGWGANGDGQLGFGDRAQRTMPFPIGARTDWSFAEGSASSDHSCALTMDGSMFCVGQNDYGQLGQGAAGPDELSFLQVPGSWRSVALGGHFSCGVQVTGTLWCWGRNHWAQLGQGDIGIGTNRPSPTRVGTATDWVRVANGENHACAINRSDQLWCWGQNTDGQIGDGTTTTALTPQRVGTLADWATVRGGDDHTCGIHVDGSLDCWGRNSDGQAGQGAAGGDVLAPTRVGASTTWTDIALGQNHSCGVDGGVLYCWGRNLSGQLGVGDRMIRAAPTVVCW